MFYVYKFNLKKGIDFLNIILFFLMLIFGF